MCWLREHAVSHHKLAVQLWRQSGRTDIVLLEQAEKFANAFCVQFQARVILRSRRAGLRRN